MKYSFVIPTYNNCKNLLKTLDCLIQLDSYPAFSYEVIVVDDGSTDDTYAAAIEYKAELDIQVLHIKRDKYSCRARARNLGWRNAKGDIIVFIDSDILVKCSHLKELDRYFFENENALIIGCRIHMQQEAKQCDISSGKIFSDNQFKNETYNNIDYRYVVFSAESFNGNAILDPWLHAYSCNIAIRKEWLIKTNGFDENIRNWGLEDIELAYRFHQLGVKILINPYLEVLHQNSYECHDDINIRKNRLEGYRDNINYFLKKHPQALLGYEDPLHLLIYGKKYTACAEEGDVINFSATDDVQKKKEQVLLSLKTLNSNVIFKDYTENANFDCWVQNLPITKNKILYFPMSKMIEVEKMMQFIEEQRNKKWIDLESKNMKIYY
jgi:glycosyltransferase involved in cell wall biosynthesis